MTIRRVPNQMSGLLSQSTTMASAVAEHGTALDLKHTTALAITTARNAVVNANTSLTAAQDLLRQRYAALAALCKEMRRLGMLAREALKPTFGYAYSTAWNGVGFLDSMAIPSKVTKLETMAETMKIFFADNPTLELTPRVTSVRAGELYNAISNARTAVESQKTVVKELLKDRDEKVAVLYDLLLVLVGELDITMDPLDARWLSFGLAIPGIPKTPEVPTGLAAMLIGVNGASVKWNRSTRAKYYRVWKKVIGVDDDFIPVGTPADLDFTLEGLPGNATIEIAVSAANGGGESDRSVVAVVTTL